MNADVWSMLRDLDPIHRIPAQVVERGVTAAKIIDRDREPAFCACFSVDGRDQT
jgi:hypothetical protein